jgi:hypothetical protein
LRVVSTSAICCRKQKSSQNHLTSRSAQYTANCSAEERTPELKFTAGVSAQSHGPSFPFGMAKFKW